MRYATFAPKSRFNDAKSAISQPMKVALPLLRSSDSRLVVVENYTALGLQNGYLVDYSSWSQCLEPSKVVEWNIILFSILIALSALQVMICFCKAIHDCMIALCGTHKIFSTGNNIN
ncbi:unnamed protein product [Ranitomeya imitator]|uniref:Uncharacterized protein n=1 Tax=Ranitomeya imitator TaxID=111125 RepID=A0ABN9LR60_9NEOB|nr:unnamed protein product [Ranitomeya imitator]